MQRGTACGGKGRRNDDDLGRHSSRSRSSSPSWHRYPGGSLDRISATTIAAPGPIAIGDTVTGNVSAGAVDTYSLFVSSAGATVVLGVSDNSCNCRWSLTGPNGAVFDQALASVGPRWLAPGDYSLVVRSTAAGSYRFDVVSAPTPQSFTTALGATVSAGAPAAGAGNIESPGAQDVYTFTVPASGASVVISVLSNACTCVWSLRVASGPARLRSDRDDRHPSRAARRHVLASSEGQWRGYRDVFVRNERRARGRPVHDRAR